MQSNPIVRQNVPADPASIHLLWKACRMFRGKSFAITHAVIRPHTQGPTTPVYEGTTITLTVREIQIRGRKDGDMSLAHQVFLVTDRTPSFMGADIEVLQWDPEKPDHFTVYFQPTPGMSRQPAFCTPFLCLDEEGVY